MYLKYIWALEGFLTLNSWVNFEWVCKPSDVGHGIVYVHVFWSKHPKLPFTETSDTKQGNDPS